MEEQLLLYPNFHETNIVPPSGIKSKLRIAIVMLNSPNIPDYAHYSTMTNYMYASQHGYDFIVERTPLDTENKWAWDPLHEYTLVWYKADFLKKHLKNYHYILYIDSDAHFLDFNFTIENELITRFNNDFSLIFQEDIFIASFTKNNQVYRIKDHTPTELCAGGKSTLFGS